MFEGLRLGPPRVVPDWLTWILRLTLLALLMFACVAFKIAVEGYEGSRALRERG